MAKSWIVYDIVEADEVVYVGFTCNEQERIKQHRSHGIMGPTAKLLITSSHTSERAARRAERDRIREIGPARNRCSLSASARGKRAFGGDQAMQLAAAAWRGALLDMSDVDALAIANSVLRSFGREAVSSTTMAWRVFGDRRKVKR